MNSGTGIYKSGVLAFFAGAILIGALLGAVTFCFMGSDELSMLSVFSNSFVDVRSSGDLEEILVRSFFSSTVFLAVVFLSGFSSLGQPLAVAVLLLRGMGWGVAMSQLYSIYGGHGALLSAMFVLLPAVITAAALMIAAREAVAMSNILLCIVFYEIVLPFFLLSLVLTGVSSADLSSKSCSSGSASLYANSGLLSPR